MEKPRTDNGKRTVSSINGVGKTRQPHAKRLKLNPYLKLYTYRNTEILTQNGLKT